jgi:DNA-binding MarR family transcriptional regulator
MSVAERDARLIELVDAFTELGPAWIRWVEATIPDDTVSYARLRALNALEAHLDGLTMTRLAERLGVTRRRVTALIDALAEDGLVERYAHPTDGRSTVVAITAAGRAQQHQVWEDHQDKVAVAFGDLADQDQIRLLDISHQLTGAFRRHLAGLATRDQPVHYGDPDAVLIRNNRRVRPPRPQAPTG